HVVAHHFSEGRNEGINLAVPALQRKGADGLQRVVQEMRVDLRLQRLQLVRLVGELEPVFPHDQLVEPLHQLMEPFGQNADFVMALHADVEVRVQTAALDFVDVADQFFDRIGEADGNNNGGDDRQDKEQRDDETVDQRDAP